MNRNFLIKLFILTICISIIFKLIQLIVRVYNIIILNLVIIGDNSYRKNLNFIVQEIKIENSGIYLTAIPLFVLMSIWFYLKYKDAHFHSSLNLSYKPIWALFSFIIPIFNLFAPYRIMNELWTVYNRDMSLETWGKKQIKIWWFLSITIFVFSRYIGIKSNHVENLHDYLSLEYISLVYLAISLHLYSILFKIVKFLESK